MAKRRATPEEQLGSPDLALPRVDAAAKLHERIEKGSELRGRPVRSDEELRSARDEFKRWHDYNSACWHP